MLGVCGAESLIRDVRRDSRYVLGDHIFGTGDSRWDCCSVFASGQTRGHGYHAAGLASFSFTGTGASCFWRCCHAVLACAGCLLCA